MNVLSKSLILLLMVAACGKKPSPESTLDKETISKELNDLTNFPKEWIMMWNIAPDTVYIPDSRVLLYPDSTYWGKISIKYRDGIWIMSHLSYDVADSFEIQSCKRSTEMEMVYYNFDMQQFGGPAITLQVNFRDNAENPQSSVFSFHDQEARELEFISKEHADKMPVYVTEGYD